MKKIILMATIICLMTVCYVTAETVERKMTVQGLCGMCKTRIEKTALNINGVNKAEWQFDTMALTVQFDSAKTTLENISEELAKAGHDTDRDKADDNVYNALPNCCKYR